MWKGGPLMMSRLPQTRTRAVPRDEGKGKVDREVHEHDVAAALADRGGMGAGR